MNTNPPGRHRTQVLKVVCVFFAVVHAALVPAALVLAKLEARKAGARVGVAEPRGDRATQREDRAVGLALHWLGEWASLDVLCLGCYLVHENYLKQVACTIDATTFDAATGLGSRIVYESSVKIGFQLCLAGSLTSLVAGAAVAALHYPDASATVDAADLTKVEPFDGKKVVAAEEGHPLDAKS